MLISVMSTVISFALKSCISRHVSLVVNKQEFAPCDAELNALRNDQEWDPEKAKLASAEKVKDAFSSILPPIFP